MNFLVTGAALAIHFYLLTEGGFNIKLTHEF
jgi:hypothetical protein